MKKSLRMIPKYKRQNHIYDYKRGEYWNKLRPYIAPEEHRTTYIYSSRINSEVTTEYFRVELYRIYDRKEYVSCYSDCDTKQEAIVKSVKWRSITTDKQCLLRVRKVTSTIIHTDEGRHFRLKEGERKGLGQNKVKRESKTII